MSPNLKPGPEDAKYLSQCPGEYLVAQDLINNLKYKSLLLLENLFPETSDKTLSFLIY